MENQKNTTSKKKSSKKGKIERFVQKTLSLIPGGSRGHFPNAYRQHVSTNSLAKIGSFKNILSDSWHKRALRNAVHSRDHNKIKAFLMKGLDIHTVISDVFWDTPLTYAVKCGYLDIVEMLLRIPGCNVDHMDRSNHSTLDEAVRALLLSRANDSRKTIASRYRIIKCLLCAGAKEITPEYIDTVIFSVINTRIGLAVIQRMVKVVAENGSKHVKSNILSILIPYKGTTTQLKHLLKQAASPSYFVQREALLLPLPNAILLIRYGSTEVKFLRHIHILTTQHVHQISNHWSQYQLMFRLLAQSGLKLRLSVMNYLYLNHASFYLWVVKYETRPKPLLDICRQSVRNNMIFDNILLSTQRLQDVPESIKNVLLLK